MGEMGPILIIVAAVVLIPIFWWIGTKNGFVKVKNHIAESWADIDVQLKRRYDLIPNLVETVKGYASHEKELLEKLVAAREHAISAHGVHNQAEAAGQVDAAASMLMARMEAYPDLKASANFLQLQQELADTEDRIAAARRFYNANVRQWNTMLQMFPSSIIANSSGYMPEEFFEITNPIERENVQVKF